MIKKSLSKTEESGRLGYSHRRHLHERLIEITLFLTAFFSVAVTLAIVVMLAKESFVFFSMFPFLIFLLILNGRRYLMMRIMAYAHLSPVLW